MVLYNDVRIWLLAMTIFLALMEVKGLPPVEVQENHETNSNVVEDDKKHFVSKRFASPETFRDVEEYPSEDDIEYILKINSRKIEDLFTEDLVVTGENQNRISNGLGEESLCRSKEEKINLTEGGTCDGSWNLTINNQKYIRSARVEKCSHPGKSCLMAKNFPNGYQTECRQKYFYLELLAMDDSGKTTVKKSIKVPSGCECVLIPVSPFSRDWYECPQIV